MGVDRETIPNSINIVLDDNVKYIASLRKQAIEDGQNYEDGIKKISLTGDKHTIEPEEYYFEESEEAIHFTCIMKSDSGESYIYIDIPLSDTLLIDIMQYAIKKLNKLKNALESLK